MSILEKGKKGKLDDTVPLKCSVNGFIYKDGHTVGTLLFCLVPI